MTHPKLDIGISTKELTAVPHFRELMARYKWPPGEIFDASENKTNISSAYAIYAI